MSTSFRDLPRLRPSGAWSPVALCASLPAAFLLQAQGNAGTRLPLEEEREEYEEDA
jgi:hypothetical protein